MENALVTPRLVLRRPLASDAAAIVCAVNDVEVTRWLTQLPYPYTHSDAASFIGSQAGLATFLICQNDTPIGCISTEGEFGYWLARTHWGQGIMTEASRAILPWHFETAGTTLISGHAVGNARSRSVLLKMGFKDTEIAPRTHQITGAIRQQQFMALTHDQWKQAS